MKSNVTDNESAKLKAGSGFIQGYNALALVDAKHQIVVHAEPIGQELLCQRERDVWANGSVRVADL